MKQVIWLIGFMVVLAGCGGGSSSGNDDSSGSGDSTLLAPQSLMATAGNGKVALSWNGVAAATDYCVYLNDVAGIHPDTAASYDIGLSDCLGSAVTSNTVTGLTNDTEYFFVVTAKDGSAQSAASNEVAATPAAPVITSRPLNDTGITLCGDYAYDGVTPSHQNDLDCAAVGATQTTAGTDSGGDPVPAGQDAVYGRDAQAQAGSLIKVGGGAAGFDFTKLDGNGIALPASATGWSCVLDNVTGLVWEVKTTDGGLRDRNHSYTWYNSANNGGNAGFQDGGSCFGSDCDTHGYVQAVNAQGLCGASDWRMPSRNELMSIVHNGSYTPAPAIDTDYFPNTLAERYWTSSPYARSNINAWNVTFFNGRVDQYFKDNNMTRVRLVRVEQ